MTNVVQMKLSSGEWIVGAVKEQLEPKDYITLEKALVIHVVPKDHQSYGIALIPFNPTNPEDSVDIYKSAIVARPSAIAKGLYDAYLQRTTGIEIVSNLDGA